MENKLFAPFHIGGLAVRSRFVRSATHEGLADENGFYTEKLSDVLTLLAEHEVGLIISGHAFVSPEGRASALQATAATDEAVPFWRETVGRVHAHGAKIALQLAHAGGNTATAGAAGPSAFAQAPGRKECRALTPAEIHALQNAFADAARFLNLKGYEPVNPFDNGLPAEAHWRLHMRADIALLLGCDYIYMLQGWELSKGAKLELDVASSCGISVMFENQFNP